MTPSHNKGGSTALEVSISAVCVPYSEQSRAGSYALRQHQQRQGSKEQCTAAGAACRPVMAHHFGASKCSCWSVAERKLTKAVG